MDFKGNTRHFGCNKSGLWKKVAFGVQKLEYLWNAQDKTKVTIEDE